MHRNSAPFACVPVRSDYMLALGAHTFAFQLQRVIAFCHMRRIPTGILCGPLILIYMLLNLLSKQNVDKEEKCASKPHHQAAPVCSKTTTSEHVANDGSKNEVTDISSRQLK